MSRAAPAASIFHLTQSSVRTDLSTVAIEDDAPMNPPSQPPHRASQFEPLLARMKVGQSVTLPTWEALSFLRWLRAIGARASQSKHSELRMRVKVLSKPKGRKA